MQELMYLLHKKINQNLKKIQGHISKFENEKVGYKNIEIERNLCLILRKQGFEKLMIIGFPFPLESSLLTNFKAKDQTLIFIFLRGEPVRRYQRKIFLEELSELGEINFKEIDSIMGFRRITKKICQQFHSVDYYDPYSFLGDSLIGLHFINSFVKKHKIKLNRVYSENHQNLEIITKTKGYDEKVSKKKKTLNILSDLIDDQWDRTKYLVRCLTKQRLPSIICGRDLIIYPEKNRIKIYHFNREEVLLREENIEDYMNNCLLPFLDPIKSSFKVKKRKSNNIIVNPFGSEQIKTISEKTIFRLANHFNREYPHSKILLIAGFKKSYYHLLWVSKLRGLLSNKGLNNILFKNYISFKEIKRDIICYNISFGLTADTSIAHLFNCLGLRNITLFNLDRCDLSSPQSLSSDSPLGFCRYGQVQFPAILYKNNNKDLDEGIIKATDYFLGRNKNLKWCKLIFNNETLISKINKKNKSLIESNKKINPMYKIQND
mgnify:CR=1 FL=1